MFKKKELVVYENKGVCCIEDIREMEFPDEGKRKYYILHPIDSDGTFYTPVDNPKVSMRPVISKKEALDIIGKIPSAELKSFDGLRSIELEAKYKESIRTHNCEDLIKLEMSIYRKCKSARKAGKKVSELDGRYLKHLDDLINGELGIALDIPKDEVPDFIAEKLDRPREKHEKK